jgi:hypothetical protein
MESTHADLLHYKRKVSELYVDVRGSAGSPEDRWRVFRRARENLFRTHPQSALTVEQKAEFNGLNYFDYNPALRLLVDVQYGVEQESFDVPLQKEGLMRMTRFGQANFELNGNSLSLSLFWIEGYGGGVFLPFRDGTNGAFSYGGGRYLLDTIKGADLGQQGDKWVLDFNYAYNPSCAYNPSWHCPLAPTENWLTVPIEAGERKFSEAP